jgi:polar amino acid transport system substrate-binding protein
VDLSLDEWICHKQGYSPVSTPKLNGRRPSAIQPISKESEMTRRWFQTAVLILLAASLLLSCSPVAPTQSVKARLATRTPQSGSAVAAAAPTAVAVQPTVVAAQATEPVAAPTGPKKTITLATLEWPPYVGEKLPGNGITTEIIKEAFARMGYEVKLSYIPWTRVLQDVKDGKVEAGYPAYYSDERAATYQLSDKFAAGNTGFFKRKAQAIPYTKLEDLKGLRIGIIRGYANPAAFEAATYLTKEEATDDEQNLRKLAAGRIDLALADKFTAQYILNTTFPEGKDALEFVEPALETQPLYIMFSRKVTGFDQKAADFNAGLKLIQADGTVDKILASFGGSAPATTEVQAAAVPTPVALTKSITLATLEWPPYVGEKLPGNGITTEIIKEAFARVGYEVKLSYIPWTRVLQDVKDGKVEAGYPAYYSDERAATYQLSDKFAAGNTGFFKRKAQAIPYTKLEDLKGLRIGIIRGYANPAAFEAATYLTKEEAADDEQNLRKLAAGRIDLALADKFTAQYILNTTFPEGKDALEFVEPVLDTQPLYVMFSRKVTGFDQKAADFNAGLKLIQADGTVDKILASFGGNAPATTEAQAAVEPTPVALTKSITLATLEWPPYVGEKLPGNGITTEIIKEAFARMGYEVKLSYIPWTRVLQDVKDGKVEAGYPAYYSDERAVTYQLSDKFAAGTTGFFKRKAQAIAYTKLEDLKGLRIGIIRGYANPAAFEAATYLTKEEAADDEQNLRKLAAGRIDLALADKFTAQYILNTTFPEGKDALEFVEPVLDTQPLYIMFSRKVTGFDQKATDFNAGLKLIQADGTVDKILAKYGSR